MTMSLADQAPEILECTLRDGSYVVGYQFTAEDTALLAAGLERVGFRRIEVGHGLGLGASERDLGVAAETDDRYLEAAASVLSDARFGAFFIPGIGEVRHLRSAAAHGMDFVRIGTNVTETEEAEPFLKEAKDLGMEVSCNLMKTYALPQDEILRRSVDLAGWGADTVCVVDSAGGMLPAEVGELVARVKGEIDATVGFHGHNNCQLAMANTLAAIEAGAGIVDSTLRGLGRSAGNAQTEALVMLLQREGVDLGIDVLSLLDLAERVVAPWARGRGVDAVELVSGVALFHSSFLGLVLSVAEEYGVDPRELVLQVSEWDRVEVTEDLARRVAEEIRDRGSPWSPRPIREEVELETGGRPGVEGSVAERARSIARHMRSAAMKSGKRSVFTIAPSLEPHPHGTRFPFVRSNSLAVIGNADVASFGEALEVAEGVDGEVEFILVSGDRPWPDEPDAVEKLRGRVSLSEVVRYGDTTALVQGVQRLMATLDPGPSGPVGVLGDDVVGGRIALAVAGEGRHVRLLAREGEVEGLDPSRSVEVVDTLKELCRGCAVLISASGPGRTVTREVVELLAEGATIVVISQSSVSEEAVSAAVERGMLVVRLDMRAGLSGEIVAVLESKDLAATVMGRETINGVEVVAGGIVGPRGTVVVDSISAPEVVVGVADGGGGLLDEEAAREYTSSVEAVRAELLRRRVRVP